MSNTKRKHFIDNLRILSILMLFPFHASMCFCSLNGSFDSFYIHINDNVPLSMINLAVYPWWMSLMFALAGTSSLFALKKRTPKEYIRERLLRLFVPFVSGVLLWVPLQSYFADLYRNNWPGNYFEHYAVFFTKYTDLTGYDGGFTPGHLWFILFLFVYSLVFLPLMNRFSQREPHNLFPDGAATGYPQKTTKTDLSKISLPFLLVGGFVLLCGTGLIGNVGGKGVLEFAMCFLLGFFLFTDDKVVEKLKCHWMILAALWAALMISRCACWVAGIESAVFWYLDFRALEWTGMLGAVAAGARFLDFKNRFTDYFSPACFPLYWLHQSVLVAVAFFAAKLNCGDLLQFILITAASFAASLGLYELCRRVAFLRFLTGIKTSPRPNKTGHCL